ncbi:hypothetical protein [Streptomyces sp. NPDC056713]
MAAGSLLAFLKYDREFGVGVLDRKAPDGSGSRRRRFSEWA